MDNKKKRKMNAASEIQIVTVKFNVGGQKFDVARSLLALYPDTMIAKSASDQWQQQDPMAEIFVERDGTLFQFVLSYLRDGKVHLPLTTSKQAVLDELSYYGAEVVDEQAIDDGQTQGVLSANAFRDGIDGMTKIANEARKDSRNGECAFIAAVLIENYMTNAYKLKYGKAYTKQYTVEYPTDSQEAKQIRACFFGVSETVKEANLARCNKYLNKVNLKLMKYQHQQWGGVAVTYPLTLTMEVIAAA